MSSSLPLYSTRPHLHLHSFPTRRSSDLSIAKNYLNEEELSALNNLVEQYLIFAQGQAQRRVPMYMKVWIEKLNRSEEHTSELQSRGHLVCRLLLEKKKELQDLEQVIKE